MMSAPADILKFQDVSITVDSAQGSGIGHLNLSLTAGDLRPHRERSRSLAKTGER